MQRPGRAHHAGVIRRLHLLALVALLIGMPACLARHEDAPTAGEAREEAEESVDGNVGAVEGNGDPAAAEEEEGEELSEWENEEAEPEPYDPPGYYEYETRDNGGGYGIPQETASPETPPTHPPPPPPPETTTATTTLERYPSVFAPDTAAYGTTFDVEVQLTEELETPQVECVACGPMVLPEAESWDIDVILIGEGFEVSGEREKRLVLKPRGDSTTAVFRLTALPSSADEREGELRVSFWHGATFLMEAVRPIVYHDPSVPPPTVEAAAGDAPVQHLAFELTREEPDLAVMVAQRQVIIKSPYVTVEFDALHLPEDFDAWLERRYAQLSAAGRGFRSAAVTPTPSRVAKRLGRDLYRLTPEKFQTVLWMLLDNPEMELRTIQVTTDDPRFPWELIIPARLDGSDERDFFGLDHTIARWHVQSGSRVNRQAIGLIGLEETVVVAPNYDPPLVAVAGELEDLAAFAAGTAPLRRVEARRTAVEALLDAPRPGIIHFAGHGLASVVGDAGPRFSLELEDGPLFLDSVRGGERWEKGIHPFIFVNACDVGRADRYGGFVEGWAPALLDAGAVGYLGALWPVGDAAAASFAQSFYDRLEDSIVRGHGRVATAVRDARRRYHQEPDPSYLAYVYYGNVGLLFRTVDEDWEETP